LSRRDAGFTLIELLVVITVLAILASMVSPMVFRNVGDAKVSAARSQIDIFSLALDAYRLDNDYYPSTVQGLAALTARPDGPPAARNWRGPYLKRGVPLDPWGRPYLYTEHPRSTDNYLIRTLGRDGEPGGRDEDTDLASSEESEQ
jgi:general secretion pathway protein G